MHACVSYTVIGYINHLSKLSLASCLLAKFYVCFLHLHIASYIAILHSYTQMGKGGGNGASSLAEVFDSISNLLGPLYPAAFILLYLYLTIYNIHQTANVNEKDEDFIDCTCRTSDKKFYGSLFWGFTITWMILVLIWQLIRLVDGCILYVQ